MRGDMTRHFTVELGGQVYTGLTMSAQPVGDGLNELVFVPSEYTLPRNISGEMRVCVTDEWLAELLGEEVVA